jgi:hypothetical protein
MDWAGLFRFRSAVFAAGGDGRPLPVNTFLSPGLGLFGPQPGIDSGRPLLPENFRLTSTRRADYF